VPFTPLLLSGGVDRFPSELWEKPLVSNVNDDEFNSGVLNGNWTRFGYTTPSASVIDPLADFNTGDPREDINVRRSYIRFQAPRTSLEPPSIQDNYGIFKNIGGGELPNGTYWVRIFSPYNFGNIEQSDGELRFGLYIDDGGGLPDFAAGQMELIPQEKDNTVTHGQLNRDPGGSTQTSNVAGIGNHWTYAAILKDGSNAYGYILGYNSWTYMGSRIGGTALEFVAITANNAADAVGDVPGNAIVGCDFFRYIPPLAGGELVLP